MIMLLVIVKTQEEEVDYVFLFGFAMGIFKHDGTKCRSKCQGYYSRQDNGGSHGHRKLAVKNAHRA